MSYSTLIVYLDVEGEPEHRVRLAGTVADKFNASLIGLSACMLRPPFVAEGVVIQDLTETDIKELKSKLAEKGNWFRGTVGPDRRKIEWRSVVDFPTEALAREARSADLIVIGQKKGPGDAYDTLDPGGTILKVGRPTLVVPEGVSELQAEHVLIGWKDTREARRAVQDALPFLREAARVTIVEICRSGEEETAREHIDDVSRYLQRHKIKGGPQVILHQNGPDAAQLIRLAQDEHADLLVTGAYGHSRLGEWVFGGVTRDLLAMSPICCLMSH
jgi:nucleotide-binding universal stress UspA family protein